MGNIFGPRKSPNGRHVAVIHDLHEPAMGYTMGTLSIRRSGSKVAHVFEDFMAIPGSVVWSRDSRHFTVSGYCGFPAVLVCDCDCGRFAVVRVGNPYPLDAKFTNKSTLRIEVSPAEVRAANSSQTFGKGKAAYPIERFKPSPPLVLKLDRIKYLPMAQLKKIGKRAAKFPLHDLRLESDGYFPFKGAMPQNTWQAFNGRPMEVFHLVAFAEYGDKVALQWLREVRRVAGKRNVHWEKVADLIGRKRRPKDESSSKKSAKPKGRKRTQTQGR